MILLTDSLHEYESSEGNKLLTDGFIVLSCNFLDELEIAAFNAQLNGAENDAAEQMITELERVCETFPRVHVNPFLQTRNNDYDIAYSLLYPNFKEFITLRFLIEGLVKKLKSTFNIDDQFCLNFASKAQSIQYSNYLSEVCSQITIRPTQKTKNSYFLRSVFYRFVHLKRKFTGKKLISKKKYSICLFFYDTPNDIELFHTLFEIIKNDSTIELSIVQLESGIPAEKAVSAKYLQCENIKVFKLQDFRTPVTFRNKPFRNLIQTQFPEYAHFLDFEKNTNSETYYYFINEALKQLKPKAVLYDNTGEVGRYLSDVARFHSIPSAVVEYGLFSNDFIHMASNICFDLRLCLGEESIQTWKGKKDPSKKHVPIGFIKLDHSEELSKEKQDFSWESGGFEKVIFFASTWSGTNSLYNVEKTQIVTELSDMCKRNNWCLVIKKHPAEYDQLLDQLDVVQESHVFLYQHNQIQLFQLLSSCDVVCTQNSSITVEALLHNKPTIFYNKSENGGLAELVPMSKEPFVFFVHDSSEFEHICKQEHFEDTIFEDAKAKYLFKTDQSASFRMLNELKQAIDGL